MTENNAALTDYDRWALEIFEMVRALHDRGYQRLRVCAGPSIRTNQWSIAVTPSTNVMRRHGARIAGPDNAATHEITAKDALFGWRTIGDRSPTALAERFAMTWPDICEEGKGRDWPYVGWYCDFLRFARRGQYPTSFENWGKSAVPASQAVVPLVAEPDDGPDQLPKPPGGEYGAANADDARLFAAKPIPEVPQALEALDPLLARNRSGDGRCWDFIPRSQ
jgi:hypothetical protein